jgi:hypothetical protein
VWGLTQQTILDRSKKLSSHESNRAAKTRHKYGIDFLEQMIRKLEERIEAAKPKGPEK